MLDIQPPNIPVTPGVSTTPSASLDVFKYLGVAMQIMQAIAAGVGTFSSWTPLGKRWITISDKPPGP